VVGRLPRLFRILSTSQTLDPAPLAIYMLAFPAATKIFWTSQDQMNPNILICRRRLDGVAKQVRMTARLNNPCFWELYLHFHVVQNGTMLRSFCIYMSHDAHQVGLFSSLSSQILNLFALSRPLSHSFSNSS
jgi:hypothetical protein